MTTDPIAAARAMIEPLTGYTPRPWAVGRDLTIGPNGCGVAVIVAANTSQAAPTDARLIAAAPDLRDMVSTLADALDAERAKVAAAYEAAAKRCYEDQGRFDTPDRIRSLTPADAKAALDKMLAEARLEGCRAGRDAALAKLSKRATNLHESPNTTHRVIAGELSGISEAIRALPEPKEASHD